MSVMRSLLLAGSDSAWLRRQAPRFWFVRKSVSRFMPGEKVDDALRDKGIGTILTRLGKNIQQPSKAAKVTEHYWMVLDRIRESGLGTEISVKLTHLGLELAQGGWKSIVLIAYGDHWFPWFMRRRADVRPTP